MSTERVPGFYWVIYDGRWTIAEFLIGRDNNQVYFLHGTSWPFRETNFSEIDPTPIVRNIKNEQA